MANVELTEVLLYSVLVHDTVAPSHSLAFRPCQEHLAIEVWTGVEWEVWVSVGSSDAAGVAFAPTGLIVATDVQAAIAELDTEVGSRITVAVNALVAGAPGALDTLDELAAALGDDASFASSVTTLLAGKQASASLDADVTVLAEDSGSDLGAFLAGLGGGGGSTGDASWTDATYTNSWVSFGAPYAAASYRKDGQGFVHLRGAAKTGAVGSSIFTLPVGYRPGANEAFHTDSSVASGTSLIISTTGTVAPQTTGASSFCSLSAITFYAEN